jgi:hypothetical protein
LNPKVFTDNNLSSLDDDKVVALLSNVQNDVPTADGEASIDTSSPPAIATVKTLRESLEAEILQRAKSYLHRASQRFNTNKFMETLLNKSCNNNSEMINLEK